MCRPVAPEPVVDPSSKSWRARGRCNPICGAQRQRWKPRGLATENCAIDHRKPRTGSEAGERIRRKKTGVRKHILLDAIIGIGNFDVGHRTRGKPAFDLCESVERICYVLEDVIKKHQIVEAGGGSELFDPADATPINPLLNIRAAREVRFNKVELRGLAGSQRMQPIGSPCMSCTDIEDAQTGALTEIAQTAGNTVFALIAFVQRLPSRRCDYAPPVFA